MCMLDHLRETYDGDGNRTTAQTKLHELQLVTNLILSTSLWTERNDGIRSSVSTDEAMQNKGFYSQGLVLGIGISTRYRD